MGIDLPPCEGLSKSFITALLLTANLDRAESAVMRSIGRLDECVSSGALLQGTLRASLAGPGGMTAEVPEDLAEAGSILPPELQHVVHLPKDLRQCFVLRILLGLSREVCASLLGLDVQRIDEQTCASIFQLAVTQDKRPAN